MATTLTSSVTTSDYHTSSLDDDRLWYYYNHLGSKTYFKTHINDIIDYAYKHKTTCCHWSEENHNQKKENYSINFEYMIQIDNIYQCQRRIYFDIMKIQEDTTSIDIPHYELSLSSYIHEQNQWTIPKIFINSKTYYYSIDEQYLTHHSTPPTRQLTIYNFVFSQYLRLRNPNFEPQKPKIVNYFHSQIVIQKWLNTKKNLENKTIVGGHKVQEPIWVFHGTNEKNLENIMCHGFKVGGNEISVQNGRAYGNGVYTSTEPTTAVMYSSGMKNHFRLNQQKIVEPGTTIILSLALLGNHADANEYWSNQRVSSSRNPDSSFDSWSPSEDRGWIIFRDGTQLLPRYTLTF
jgi:hypothetical protein